MKKYFLILFSFLTLVCPKVFSTEINIVDVHRNITLSDDDPIYKDFYLNAGESAGLKKNLVVLVKRKMTIKDSNSKTIGDFETTVGQLRIIQVDSKVSVAREYKLFSRDEEAMIEQIGLMTGDRVDLTGAFIDATKPVTKKKVAEIETEPMRLPADATEKVKSPTNESPMKSATPLVTPEI